jgi:hypothetical protein
MSTETQPESTLSSPTSTSREVLPGGMSAAGTDVVEFPYKAISRGAVVAIVMAVLAIPGLIPEFAPLLALCILGIIAAIVALRSIRRYPEEFSGRGLALAALAINGLLLGGGASLHTYTYMTEVPEGYTRVKFYELQQDGSGNKLQRPTDKAIEVHDQDIFLKGYIHPSSGSGLLKHFILVPDLGTCCFGGQPESSDMVEVTLSGGQSTEANMRKKKLAGKFRVNQAPQSLTDFDNAVFYRLRADQVK